MSDIKRNAERAVIAYLRTTLPAVHFVPSKGDDEDNDPLARPDGSLEPPFCVVECYEAERLLSGEPVHDAKLNICYVTHLSESTSAAHSLVVEQITDALAVLPRGWHPLLPAVRISLQLAGATDQTQFSPVDSEGIAVGMQITSYDFPAGTEVLEINNPGPTAELVLSLGKLSSGTAPCVFGIAYGVKIHGHDIGTATSTEDEENRTFADVIPLTLGITG